jgi:hypothetical protein
MPHPDLDQLLNILLPFAQQTLANHGELIPFGLSMKIDGTIVANVAYEKEHAPSQEIVDLLAQAFRQSALNAEIRAAGICYDTRVTPPGETQLSDAICASLEHQSGDAMDVFVPYAKVPRGEISYRELFAIRHIPQLFIARIG